jgi:hypothetical protein
MNQTLNAGLNRRGFNIDLRGEREGRTVLEVSTARGGQRWSRRSAGWPVVGAVDDATAHGT